MKLSVLLKQNIMKSTALFICTLLLAFFLKVWHKRVCLLKVVWTIDKSKKKYKV
jgi:hypothetical protein